MQFKQDWVTLTILVAGILLTVYTANNIYQRDLRGALLQLETDVQQYAANLTSETERSLTLLSTLKSFLSVSRIRRNAFYSIADDAMQRYEQLQGVAWVPYVRHDYRDEFEMFQQKHDPGFEFKQRQGEGFIRAPDREFYLPVYYQRSRTNDFMGNGLDLAIGPLANELELLEEGAEDQFIVDMMPSYDSTLSGEMDVEHFMTVVMPVYKKANGQGQLFRGFLIGAIRVGSLQQFFLAEQQYQHIDLVVADVTSDKSTIILIINEDVDGDPPLEEYEYITRQTTIGDRILEFTAMPTAHYLQLVSSKSWVLAVVMGLIINLLITAYIYSLRSRNDTVQQLVTLKTRELEAVNNKLSRLSRTDSLTQLANRRYFDEYLAIEWNRARRDKRAMTLILGDVDYFKPYNDFYGHVEGDLCLQQVALSFRSCFTRSSDLVARYGGEEFAAILPGTELTDKALLDKCGEVIEGLNIEHKKSQVSDYITMSFGACTLIPSDSLSVEDIIKTADKALYRAKMEGRNRSVIFNFQQSKTPSGVNKSDLEA